MIFLEILVAIFVGFLVYKFILLPSFSNKKIALSQIPDSFHDIFTKFNNLDIFRDTFYKEKTIILYCFGNIVLCFTFIYFYFYLFKFF